MANLKQIILSSYIVLWLESVLDDQHVSFSSPHVDMALGKELVRGGLERHSEGFDPGADGPGNALPEYIVAESPGSFESGMFFTAPATSLPPMTCHDDVALEIYVERCLDLVGEGL